MLHFIFRDHGLNSPTLEVFIISWKGQHDNAISIAHAIQEAVQYVHIIYSDPDPSFELIASCKSTKRPNELMWADKFKACLDECHSDLMLVIQADTYCQDWPLLARKCYLTMSTNPLVGVWAPLIDHTPFHVNFTNIAMIDQTSLCIVAQTDGIIFCLSSDIINRMRQVNYADNILGWGIDWLFVTHAFSTGKLAVVDISVLAKHRISRGYDNISAEKLMLNFLNQNLNIPEFSQYTTLQSHIMIPKNAVF